MDSGKRKRNTIQNLDFYQESKQIVQSTRRRERILFIHRSISLAVFTLMWALYFNRFGMDGPYPVQEIMLTLGMLMIYFSHSRYVWQQNKNDEQLKNIVQLMREDRREQSEVAAQPQYHGRLVDTVDEYAIHEENDPTWQSNGNHG